MWQCLGSGHEPVGGPAPGAGGPRDRGGIRSARAQVLGGEDRARAESVDVPLPWTGQSLVKAVHVEDQIPLRRTEYAEVAQVRVAAGLDREPGARSRRQVMRHDHRGTAQEGKRRREHPAVADGDQVGQPCAVVLLQQRDRVGAAGRRAPAGVRGARHLGALGATCAPALVVCLSLDHWIPPEPVCAARPAAGRRLRATRRPAGFRRRCGTRRTG